MPVSLSSIINHSHSFTRLEIYHHIYFKLSLFYCKSRFSVLLNAELIGKLSLFFLRLSLCHGITVFQRYGSVHGKLTACEIKGKYKII